jgi:hypothetical protein
MELTTSRRPVALFAAALLALALIAAADASSIILTSEAQSLVRVSGPAIDTTVDLGAGSTEIVSLPGSGLHHVEHLGSTIVPRCDATMVETSGLVIEGDTVTPLGAAAGVDVAPGASVDCSIGD